MFQSHAELLTRTTNVLSATIEATASFGKLRKTTVLCNAPSPTSNSQVITVAFNAIMVFI